MGRVRDETSGIGPGLSGCRDRFGTGWGTSHNIELTCISAMSVDVEHFFSRGRLLLSLTFGTDSPFGQHALCCALVLRVGLVW